MNKNKKPNILSIIGVSLAIIGVVITIIAKELNIVMLNYISIAFVVGSLVLSIVVIINFIIAAFGIENNDKSLLSLILSIIAMLISVINSILIFNGLLNWYTEPEKNNEAKYLTIYKCDNNELYYVNYHTAIKNDCANKIIKILIKTENAKFINNTYNSRYIVYNDDGIRIYDAEAKDTYITSLSNDYNGYMVNSDENGKVLGLIYYNSNGTNNYSDYGYYNMSTRQKMYDNKYSNLDLMRVYNEDKNSIKGRYIVGFNEDNDKFNLALLDTTEEKELLTESIGIDCANFTYSNGYYLIGTCTVDNGDVVAIYTHDLKKVSNVSNIEYNMYDFSSNNDLYLFANNRVNVYDKNASLIKSYDLVGDVQDIFWDYYLTIENGILYIKDYNGYSKELQEMSNYTYDNYVSGYYGEGSLNNEIEKRAGYYFVLSNNNDDSGYEYYFDPRTRELDYWYLEMTGGYAKPVLYLYPEKEMNIEINFENESALTTTYPKFVDSWKVIAKPNGDLYDESGKYYYGLYWEENSNHTVDFKEGFYVTKENAINFLEEKLSIIGLNDKERNEFIMYWLPILEKNEQNLVYFELTEERDSYNKLEITPKPDSLLRIAIHVKKVNSKVEIKEQELTSFERTGFTAVEWGGINY